MKRSELRQIIKEVLQEDTKTKEKLKMVNWLIDTYQKDYNKSIYRSPLVISLLKKYNLYDKIDPDFKQYSIDNALRNNRIRYEDIKILYDKIKSTVDYEGKEKEKQQKKEREERKIEKFKNSFSLFSKNPQDYKDQQFLKAKIKIFKDQLNYFNNDIEEWKEDEPTSLSSLNNAKSWSDLESCFFNLYDTNGNDEKIWKRLTGRELVYDNGWLGKYPKEYKESQLR